MQAQHYACHSNNIHGIATYTVYLQFLNYTEQDDDVYQLPQL